MASLRSSGTYWHVRFQDKHREPREVVVSLHKADYTEAQAKRKMRDLEAGVRTGTFDPWTTDTPTRTDTLATVVDRYIEHKTAAGRRAQRGGWNEGNARDRAAMLRAFVRDVGDRPVEKLTSGHIDAYVYDGRVAQATQVGRRQMIGALLRWMREQGCTTLDTPPPIQQVRKIPVYVTEAELNAICDAHLAADAKRPGRKHAPKAFASRDWMVDVWRFAFYNGMRLMEIMNLRVGAVDLDAELVQVGDDAFVTKTKRESIIPLVPQSVELLRPLVEGRAAAERVFGRLDGRKVSSAFREAARVALPAKPGLHFHSLRHSSAVFWRTSGVALEDIRDLLRHSTIKTTEIYDQIAVTDLRARFRAASKENGRKQVSV